MPHTLFTKHVNVAPITYHYVDTFAPFFFDSFVLWVTSYRMKKAKFYSAAFLFFPSLVLLYVLRCADLASHSSSLPSCRPVPSLPGCACCHKEGTFIGMDPSCAFTATPYLLRCTATPSPPLHLPRALPPLPRDILPTAALRTRHAPRTAPSPSIKRGGEKLIITHRSLKHSSGMASFLS